jgi:integrase-like protein
MDTKTYEEIIQQLKRSKTTNDAKLRNAETDKPNKYFLTTQGLLFRQPKRGKPQRVIQPNETELILFNLHKTPIGAHLGIENTYQKLKERYYWPGMRSSVKHYIKGCDECQ